MDQTPIPEETRPHSICTTPIPDETRPHSICITTIPDETRPYNICTVARESLNTNIVGSSFSKSDILPSLYGGSMTPTDGANNRWSYPKGSDDMRYIHADSVANFTVKGQLPLSRLAPGRNYKGVFKLELTTQASGWQGDFKVSLTVPGSCQAVQPRIHTYNGRFSSFTLESNTFQLAAPQRTTSLEFSLTHTGPYNIRKGLIVKSFVIQKAEGIAQRGLVCRII